MASGLLEQIPGYEAVLKSVLKKQIQILVKTSTIKRLKYH